MKGRTYTKNGTEYPVLHPELTDEEVAGQVRMLTRRQLDHEAVCTTARDRILCLTEEKATLEAALRDLADRLSKRAYVHNVKVHLNDADMQALDYGRALENSEREVVD